MASIGLAADAWLADQISDPASDVSAYVREVRDRVAATERVIAHRRTGELMGSIHSDESTDSDGSFVGLVGSEKLVTDVLNSGKGFIDNRHKRGRPKGSSGVRPAYPFETEALEIVAGGL